jgi:hypothetical protein
MSSVRKEISRTFTSISDGINFATSLGYNIENGKKAFERNNMLYIISLAYLIEQRNRFPDSLYALYTYQFELKWTSRLPEKKNINKMKEEKYQHWLLPILAYIHSRSCPRLCCVILGHIECLSFCERAKMFCNNHFIRVWVLKALRIFLSIISADERACVLDVQLNIYNFFEGDVLGCLFVNVNFEIYMTLRKSFIAHFVNVIAKNTFTFL